MIHISHETNTMEQRSLEALRDELRQFARARDWEQFHTPKNLAMALIVEAAELVEQFQWLSPEQSQDLSPEKLEAVRQECADIPDLPYPFCRHARHRPARCRQGQAGDQCREISGAQMKENL